MRGALRFAAMLALAIVMVAGALILSPTLRSEAQNVACYFAQGGSSVVFGSGCTVTNTGTITNNGIQNGAGFWNTTSGTLLIANGASPGATCTVGQLFMDTDETVDTNCTTTNDNVLCICHTTNTWKSIE